MTDLIQDIIGTESWAACNTLHERLDLIEHVIEQHVTKRVLREYPDAELLHYYIPEDFDYYYARWYFRTPTNKRTQEVELYDIEGRLLGVVDKIREAMKLANTLNIDILDGSVF